MNGAIATGIVAVCLAFAAMCGAIAWSVNNTATQTTKQIEACTQNGGSWINGNPAMCINTGSAE